MIAEQSRLPDGAARAGVYIREYRGQDASGIVHNEHLDKAWRFSSLMEMIAIYDNILDELGAAQTAYELRTMRAGHAAKGTVMSPDKDLKINASEKPTFIVNVMYRQNASWQGTIKWVDTGVERSFRSTLEMLKLMDSAIGEDGASWDQEGEA